MIHKATIINRNNHFLGQDVLDEENEILKLTGFSGSAGTLFVTAEKSYLLVDGRYELQAKNEVNLNKTQVVMPQHNQTATWIRDNFSPNAEIDYNPWKISVKELNTYKRLFPEMRFISSGTLQPVRQADSFEHPIEYAGKTAAEKIREAADFIKSRGIDAYIITAADSVSWLANLRANALPHSPIIRAFAILTAAGELDIFTGKHLSNSTLEAEIKKYQNLHVGYCEETTPAAIVEIFAKHKITCSNLIDPCQTLKAVKNPVELHGFTNAHIKDGVAVCRFLCWLENNKKGISELEASAKLHAFRSQQPNFYSDSFTTISAADSNGAIVHYHPSSKNNKQIKNLLLLDSGAQYFNGTTDITRTLALGKPTREMVEKFTIVLKAHIALINAKFPPNTKGIQLDAIARSTMWRYGLDYNHGTGHGVGHFSNVHEGPIGMNTSNPLPIEENMVLSIEPGYYRENAFGIRIENLAYITRTENMLQFSVLTMVPIDRRLIDCKLLNADETTWLNRYHQTVYRTLAKHLDKETQHWLKNACAPI